MNSYASSVLYHFVGSRHPKAHEENFSTLCKIIESGEVRHRRIESADSPVAVRIDLSRGLANGELFDQSVTCFCDIPFEHLEPIHVGKYGRFGVGLDRQWLMRYGARPVSYVPFDGADSSVWGNRHPKVLKAALLGIETQFPEEPEESERVESAVPATPEEAAYLLRSLLTMDVIPYLKFFDANLPTEHSENFYMEREWRKYGSMPLTPGLRQIVVANGYRDRLIQRFPDLLLDIREI